MQIDRNNKADAWLAHSQREQSGRLTIFLGDFLKETLDKCGVSTEGLISDADYFTTLAFVKLADNGERNFAFARKPGADIGLKAEEIRKDIICQSRILHVGSLSLTDEISRNAEFIALKAAKNNGTIISYDPNYRASLWDSQEEACKWMRSILEYADIVKVSEEEIDKLCSDNRMVAGYHWYKYVLIANGLGTISQNESKPGDRTYDNTSFEAMADNFSTRFGYGKELISALDKLGKVHGDINKSLGWITLHQFMIAIYYCTIIIIGFLMFFSAPISLIGLLSMFLIFAITYSGAEHNKSYTYDDLKVRYIRIRHQLVEYLKNIKLPKEDVEGILASIEFADSNIKDTYEYRTMIEIVANFVFSNSQNARDTKLEQRLIEDLAHNDFFVKSAQLRVQ
jgi:hypothetical protein